MIKEKTKRFLSSITFEDGQKLSTYSITLKFPNIVETPIGPIDMSYVYMYTVTEREEETLNSEDSKSR